MEADSDIADFSRRDIALLGRTKPVLLTGRQVRRLLSSTRCTALPRRLRASAAGCAMPGSECSADPVRLARCWQRREANAEAYLIALRVARVHAACSQQIQPGDRLAAGPRTSRLSGMRRAAALVLSACA